jgi:ABC-type multidrug transport system fused ATPase/permease subunit
MEAMERLMRGRTAIMIAHRMSTLQNCDLKLELEGGRLVSPVKDKPARAAIDLAEVPR